MLLLMLVSGIVTGLIICLPPGPLAVLVMRRSMSDGAGAALVPGLGSMTADLFYACVAVFSISYAGAFFAAHQLYLHVAAATVIFFIAIKLLYGQINVHVQAGSHRAMLAKDYVMGFFLAICNPVTPVFIALVLAGLGIRPASLDVAAGVTLVLGISTGEFLWWVLLARNTKYLKKALGPSAITIIRIAAGLILMSLCVLIIVKIMAAS